MYNGIGLPTPRGSGTNGYVQRNLSALRPKKGGAGGDPPPGEEELRRLEAALAKKPNPDILDHQRKRRVELKCLELAELMEEQGDFWGALTAAYPSPTMYNGIGLPTPRGSGTNGYVQRNLSALRATETHQLAEANERKNERLRAAFGISDSYVDGSSFSPAQRGPRRLLLSPKTRPGEGGVAMQMRGATTRGQQHLGDGKGGVVMQMRGAVMQNEACGHKGAANALVPEKEAWLCK
ncbi:PREDICTED: serine/arginine repetitive matrix protein 2-like [Sturnus vulgaris]|uniref:serine/arginine repetitive matrix protein 2-like n=1 Tax=Sturnus vulgaris TaxID=9172 RepID=UPI00071A3F96|nr:PREDICTED: serine/arginine repetitive matrix protein 2-like [Sturnus vulgaris]